MQLILTPMILKLMDVRRRALGLQPARVPWERLSAPRARVVGRASGRSNYNAAQAMSNPTLSIISGALAVQQALARHRVHDRGGVRVRHHGRAAEALVLPLRADAGLLPALPFVAGAADAGTIAFQRAWPQLRGGQPLLHLLRGALGIGMLGELRVRRAPADAWRRPIHCSWSRPLLMTALSVPMHGEVVTGRRWLRHRRGHGRRAGHPASLEQGLHILHGGARRGGRDGVLLALRALTVRSLGRRNSSMSTVFWNFVLVGVGIRGCCRSAIGARYRRAEWPWLAGVGIAGRARPILDHRCISARAALGGGSFRIHLDSSGPSPSTGFSGRPHLPRACSPAPAS